MTFFIRPTDFGHYQFILCMDENIMLSSLQTFPTLKLCKDNILLLKECLREQGNICSTYSSIGGHYFYVCDKHRDPIAMSDIFSSKTLMKKCMQLVLRAGTIAIVEDQMFREMFKQESSSNLSDMVA